MRFKNLERYRIGGTGSRMQLGISPPRTPDGRAYRFSPNDKAHPRHFVLGERAEGFAVSSQTERMMQAAGSPNTVCPYSGTVGPDDAFTHPDDRAAALEIVAHAARSDAEEAVRGMFDKLAHDFAGNKYLTIKSSPRSPSKPAPRFVRSDLLRELVCDECGRDYGVFAISLFCPDCGAPNIHLHFARETSLVRQQVEIAGGLSDEQSELAYRLMGNAHEDVLTAFEATLKTVYLHRVAGRPAGAPPIKAVGNAFQNIARGRERFSEFGLDPFAGLSPETLAALTLNIQKRHVIGHNLGVADAVFAEHAVDARLGETIALVGDDILQFAEIGQMVVNGLDAWLAGGILPPTEAVVLRKPIVAGSAQDPLLPKIGVLGPLAVRIGLWASERSERGFGDYLEEEDLLAAFSDVGQDDLRMAIAELSTDEYLDTTAYMGRHLPSMNCTTDLYLDFDRHRTKNDPEADIAVLLDAILSGGNEDIDVEELHRTTGFELRRFNPLFSFVVARVDERRVFQSRTEDYPEGGFFLTDEERVELRRLRTKLSQRS
jgi:hypothetical protein